jgi:hypothetical protein
MHLQPELSASGQERTAHQEITSKNGIIFFTLNYFFKTFFGKSEKGHILLY